MRSLIAFQMESIVEKMLDEFTGVPVKTVKTFMTKTPSVFTGKVNANTAKIIYKLNMNQIKIQYKILINNQ